MDAVRKGMGRSLFVGGALCLALLVFATPAFATGVTLPTTGVDVEGTVDAMVTALGAVIATIIAAYAAFKLIKLGLRWFGRVGG